MKKFSVSTSILSLCLIATIAATALVVATRSSLAANSYSAIKSWAVAPWKKEAPFVGEVTLTATAGTAAGSFTTLKGAFDAINAGTHQGVIAISINADTSEGTATATLNASGSGAASYTSISIQPVGGAARTISGATTAGSPLIDFNGADNVTIDGLNTGGNSLTIANTTASATSGTSTIRFIGGATQNIITNSNIQGSGTMSVATNGAIIFFSTDAVTASGNDNNTISNCNIGPAGANLPTKGILGNGSITTTAIGNSGIVINNNNIFDYFGAAVTSAGVATNGGCNTWSITNNRFYQTGTRTWTTGAQHTAISIGNSSATSGAQGFTITGNIIGFASNTQTGTYALTGAGTGAKFTGISFNGISTGTTTNVNGNTVAAVSMTGVTGSGTSTASPFMGILFQEGNGITNNNTVGSQSATGSLTFSTTTTSATDVYGIYNFSSNAWMSNNNNVGGISVTNLGASGTFLLFGMRAFTGSSATWTATSNNVGGTVADSIQLNATGTASQVVGMFTSNAPTLLTSNTIRNLTTNIGTGTTTAASVIGINITTATPNHTLSQNTISGLTNTNTAAASVVTGIQFTGATANVLERNLIHSLTVATNSAAAEVNGIRVGGGTTIYRNNMIAIGAGIANAIGAAPTNAGTTGVNGINEALGTNSFFHNSVFIGGSPTAGTGASYAFNGTQVTVTRSFRDNIFFNARSNSGATGKNYAVKINGTAPNPAGLTINNNLYFANGTGAVFGFFNSLDVANLAAWKTAVGQDTGSFESNPQYLDPTNATPNLHLHPTNATVAEGNGVDVGVTDDFDGQTRASFTPVDIGADAGNFTGIDLSPPAISYTPLVNTSITTNRTLSVTLTDVTGVATGGVAPRIYYRKNAGAYFSQACALASGTVNNGTWNCTINNADMGGVTSADVISYFVIAQDTLGNLASNPAGAVAANVNTVTTPPAAPNSYTIVTAFSGTINVGTGETYTSLTNPGGIFEALNAGAFTANVIVNITSDLTAETGTHALNQWAEDGAGGYTLLLKPSGAARTISGTNVGALIRLNGADRVTFDGSTAGATATGVGGNAAIRELTIQNTNTGTSAVVIAVQSGTNGAQNNTIKNVNILGQDPTTTLAGLALGGTTPGTAGTDNDNNRVENCSVKRSIYGIYSAGQNAANPNTGSVITMNDLSATGADRVRRVGIVVFNENGVQITENSVGGLDTNESADGVAIGVGTQGIDNALTTAGGVTNALVSRNRINGVNSQNTVGFSATGIAVAGSPGGANTLVNNMISGVTAPATSPDLVAGIFVAGVTGSVTRLYHNSIAMTGDRGAVATQTASFGVAISGTDPTVELKNNIFYTTQTSGGGANAKSYAIGVATTTFANLDSNYNDFFSSGANDGGFRSGSLGGGAGTDYATLALWQAAVADDTNSQELDPGYVNPPNDLHLNSMTTPLLGDGITGFATVDFDNDSRENPPDIGADEIMSCSTITGTMGGGGTVCAGGSTSVTVTVSGGVGPYSVMLNNGGGTQMGTSPLTFMVSPGATMTYSVASGTDSFGCPITGSGSATVTVTQQPTTANAGPDQTLCTTSAATLAANSPASGTGVWSVVSGPSTLLSQFSSTSANNAMFTPAGGAGTYTLRWTISNAPCTASTDDVVLNYGAPPTAANAGPDQNLCITSAATLAANNPSVGTGVWSVISGPSTLASQFSSTSARNATFTPAGGAGTYTLRWTINNSPCTAATDDVILNYSAQPTTANTGSDQTLCGTTSATLAANAPVVGTGVWSVVTGPSTLASQFSNTGANNATFTPAGGSGSYTLRWTITNGACTSADDVVLTYNTAPAITTNPTNQSVLPGNTATFTAAASGTPTPSVQWQVSTDGVNFTNIPSATSTTLSFTAAGADNGKKYRAVFTNSCSPPATTTAAMLTTGTTPPLTVQAGGQPNNAGANLGDPAICLDPGGLVGIEAMLTNAGNAAAASTFTATLPSGLTAVAGSCIATSVNPGTCTIAANGGSVMWNGTLNAGETVSVIYRARISANAGLGSQFCIDNTGAVNGVPAQPLQYCFTLSCPLTNTRVSDQKAGAVLVFPYYTSAIGGASDTRISITNTSNDASTAANQAYAHVFFIDGTSCQQLDFFVCLTPNATFAFKASEYDPDSTGYILAVVVDNQGRPLGSSATRNPNVLIGNAFVTTPQFADNYGAESFRANSNGVATVEGNTATLYFDHTGYDAVPKQFAIEIQSPLDAAGQQVVTASLSGNLTTGQMSGAAQVGTGLAFNEKEVFGSFSNWLTGTCQARGTISTNSPRVPNGLGNLIKTGQAGSLKLNVGAAVGLLMTPRTATWKGIRSLHKTQTTATTLTIPIFVPVC